MGSVFITVTLPSSFGSTTGVMVDTEAIEQDKNIFSFGIDKPPLSSFFFFDRTLGLSKTKYKGLD